MHWLFLVAGGAFAIGVLVALGRLIAGPTLPDRVVALDLIGYQVVAVLGVYSIVTQRPGPALRRDDRRPDPLPRHRRLLHLCRTEALAMIWLDLLVVFLVLLGAAFGLLAAVGIARMPDLYTRMQSATKAGTLGVACVVLGAAVHFRTAATTVEAALVIVFLFATAPDRLASDRAGRVRRGRPALEAHHARRPRPGPAFLIRSGQRGPPGGASACRNPGAPAPSRRTRARARPGTD